MKEGDQVVIKFKSNRSGPLTKEVRVGTLAAFADENTAVVSFSRAGGRIEKKEFPIDQLQPVSDVYRRSVVQINPMHRQVYTGF